MSLLGWRMVIKLPFYIKKNKDIYIENPSPKVGVQGDDDVPLGHKVPVRTPHGGKQREIR
jgi:hypothetical protein